MNEISRLIISFPPLSLALLHSIWGWQQEFFQTFHSGTGIFGQQSRLSLSFLIVFESWLWKVNSLPYSSSSSRDCFMCAFLLCFLLRPSSISAVFLFILSTLYGFHRLKGEIWSVNVDWTRKNNKPRKSPTGRPASLLNFLMKLLVIHETQLSDFPSTMFVLIHSSTTQICWMRREWEGKLLIFPSTPRSLSIKFVFSFSILLFSPFVYVNFLFDRLCDEVCRHRRLQLLVGIRRNCFCGLLVMSHRGVVSFFCFCASSLPSHLLSSSSPRRRHFVIMNFSFLL